MKVFYPGKTERQAGLRLKPGINEVPDENGRELIRRKVCEALPVEKPKKPASLFTAPRKKPETAAKSAEKKDK